MNIQHFPIAPREPPRALDHHLGIPRDPLPMKRRLHQPPLPFVQFLLRRQQPFPKNDLRPLQHAALVKRPMLRHEQLPNQIGMIEEKDLLRTDMKLRRVAVLLRELLEERNRIALESSEVAERDAASRAW